VGADYPKYFYKYRSIGSIDALQSDHAVDALLKNKAVFSSRTNFNDLFDSKIELIKPTPLQLKEAMKLAEKADKLFIKKFLNKGKFSTEGVEFIEKLEKSFNDLIDSYAFLSVSSKATSNLMWSHYANSHKGFCIEFKSEFMKADKVIYQDKIPKLNMIDIFLSGLNLISGEEMAQHIWQSLRTKLAEWEYESEYRFQASNSMGKILTGKNFMIMPYSPEFVESVIFGCRMPLDAKKFIINGMPTGTKFKQAVARNSSIEIINFDLRIGL
jgi:hypothetical protein